MNNNYTVGYEMNNNYIPLSNCVDRGLYRIDSRNLSFGVFKKENSGFIGIRLKFNFEFLFTEYHWDTGEPFGTVKPIEYIEACPIENLKESEANKELFNWLEQKEKEHAKKDDDHS